MSKFTKEQVTDYANKLLIGLTNEENELVLKEFDFIKANMEIIANVPGIEKVEPMTHTLDDFTFTLRSDEAEDSLPIEDILKNCKNYEDREIVVPKVVGNNDSE